MGLRGAILTCALAGAFVAHAQPADRLPRIAIFQSLPFSQTKPNLDSLRSGLRELGYADGKNLRIEYRSAEGEYARLDPLAAQLAAARVDVIVASGTPASLAAKKATREIPIIMVGAADPVRSGLVSSLARPGANVTGVSNLSPELMKKRLELLVEAKPGMRRAAVLLNAANPAQGMSFEAIQGVAGTLKVQPLRFDVNNAEEIRGAFEAMGKQRAEALIIGNDTLLFSHGPLIAELAVKHGIASAGDRRFVDAGGLIGYGSTLDVWRHAAMYVDRILKGAKPAELPIEQPRQVDLILNLKTAKALGLALPQSFRLRVDKVIE